jgi:hypothetical protein
MFRLSGQRAGIIAENSMVVPVNTTSHPNLPYAVVHTQPVNYFFQSATGMFVVMENFIT